MHKKKSPASAGLFFCVDARRVRHAGGPAGPDQSPSVSSEALPPAAVVLTVIVFSVAKRAK